MVADRSRTVGCTRFFTTNTSVLILCEDHIAGLMPTSSVCWSLVEQVSSMSGVKERNIFHSGWWSGSVKLAWGHIEDVQ